MIEDNFAYVKDKRNGTVFGAKMIVGADGAHSVVAKQLANRTLDRKHHVGSVRAYYSNVDNTLANTTDIYLNKKFFPSYLWVFPLADNKANVGFGMLSSEIAKRKLNIKKTFYEFIDETPELAERFKNASQLGELEGFGLPLGSKRVQVSGDNFLLIGDAASLIDPTSGQGIGNGMLSSKLAAEQILRCFKENNFSAGFIKQYDKNLFKEIGVEMKLKSIVQRIVPKMPFLIDWYYWVTRSATLKKLMHKKFY